MEKYIEPIKNFLINYDEDINEADFISLQYDIVDQMKLDQIGFEIMHDVLELMERYPLIEFGTPGPLTHFIESFYMENQGSYEQQLIQSVQENPTVHTVWLLNRIINGSQAEKKLELLQVMNSLSKKEGLHENIWKIARDFMNDYSC